MLFSEGAEAYIAHNKQRTAEYSDQWSRNGGVSEGSMVKLDYKLIWL